MSKNIIKGLALVCVVLLLASCTMKTYVQDKARVDQEMQGNAGCLSGECPDRGDYKPTRRTYVLEVQTKPKVNTEEYITEETTYASDYDGVKTSTTTRSFSSSENEPKVIYEPAETEAAIIDYTVQKGDTLQKISKKIYDTYKRWYEIYDLNKDTLSSPDRIKPGMIIKIRER
ncbi:MAG: LysM peptidoglycan-binding domain-containing protein [Candidatus Aceula meridiana]|nr:LysM peptidoglycan-binding domain-containing protein [Candidatus Aceula meridiana]